MTATIKVAIITGASQGIGAGLVAGFRGAGYAVVGNSRSIGSIDGPDYLTVEGTSQKPRPPGGWSTGRWTGSGGSTA